MSSKESASETASNFYFTQTAKRNIVIECICEYTDLGNPDKIKQFYEFICFQYFEERYKCSLKNGVVI